MKKFRPIGFLQNRILIAHKIKFKMFAVVDDDMFAHQVTGSNKGIGFAIVKELCSKFNGEVYLTSRNIERGEAAVDELKKLGLRPLYHQLDIDDESSVIKLRNYLKITYGGLDVLVNNAAIAFKPTASETFGEQATLTLHTNFFNTLRASDILFTILKPHARIVNVSSSAGHLSHVNGDEPAATELQKKLSSDDLTSEQLCRLIQGFIELVTCL
jgi:carbonyl reductase 1